MLDCKNLKLFAIGLLYRVAIFVKYREVSTCTTLPNFIGNWRDSIGRSMGKRERKRKYILRKCDDTERGNLRLVLIVG